MSTAVLVRTACLSECVPDGCGRDQLVDSQMHTNATQGGDDLCAQEMEMAARMEGKVRMKRRRSPP